MKPVSPVYENAKDLFGVQEVVYAKDQPEYIPLPVLKFQDGTIVSRWRMSWKERLRALLTGDIFLAVLTFNQPLQPVLLATDPLQACGVSVEEPPTIEELSR